MKFSHQAPCTCGDAFSFSTYGDAPWRDAVCSRCKTPSSLTDPLSASVTAERLLYRSMEEFEDGDYTLSILIGAIAVESFLTQLFLKLKRLDNFATTYAWPTPEQQRTWEKQYKRNRGFSLSVDFVSEAITEKTFDGFVGGNTTAARAIAGVLDAATMSARDFIQAELFERRNKIAHWGFVNSTKQEAQVCHTLAVATVEILREMDNSKYGARQRLPSPPPPQL